jgi:hypothetical protein
MRIVPLVLREANDFVERWHRHSSRTSNDGGKFAIVGRPVARLLQKKGAAELLRLCVSPSAPKGANSKLYSRAKRIWQLMGGIRFLTYTLSKESRASMRGAGLKDPVAEVAQQQWDRKNRKRELRQIYEEPKVRWSEELEIIP